MKLNHLIILAVLSVLATAGVVGLVRKPSPREKARPSSARSTHEALRLLGASSGSPIVPIPALDDLDPKTVALGERLFHDPQLSRDGTISCASCHDIATGGDDGLRLSVGIGGKVGDRNAPTVLNTRFNSRQFWDGRATSLEAQVDGPIEHPKEMGSSWENVIATLAADPGYTQAFLDTFGTPPDVEHVREALAVFERSLITPNGPFDRYLAGDEDAIDDKAKRGYEVFVQTGCVACHQGVNVGGNMLQSLGRMRDYFTSENESESPEPANALFKVPSLRNVAQTAPYFHDGSVATLDDAIRIMARFQLGIDLDDDEVSDIASFLASLSGELQAK